MSKAGLISEMLKFHFGRKIFCSNGEYGVLVDVVFDPTTRVLTAIGVRRGRFFGKVVHLPFSTVQDATGDGIRLRITLDDVAAKVTAEVSGALLTEKSVVEIAGSTHAGTLLLAAVHPESGELAYIVAHHIHQGQDTLLREEFVTGLANERVTVTIPEATLAAIPHYQPDDVLQQQVESVLFDITPLHIDLKGIKIRVLDGVLYLDGNTSSSLRTDIVQDLVEGVPGLLEIKNKLVGDDTLANDIALAFGRDPRTRDLPVGVYPRLGVVRLSGSVRTAQQKAAAVEIARGFPGVRSVINELVVDPKADFLHVMTSTGAESDDLIPGKYVRHTK